MRRARLLEQWRQTAHLGAWIQNAWRGDDPIDPDDLNLVLVSERERDHDQAETMPVSFEVLERAIFGDVL